MKYNAKAAGRNRSFRSDRRKKMEEYEALEMEVIPFEAKDVILTSEVESPEA